MNDQHGYWNGPAGQRWAREQLSLDATLRPFGEAALAVAAVKPGEAVLDVGCGCGATSLALADLAAPGGRVVGLDLSAPMLARARELCAAAVNASFVEADASTVELPQTSFDLLFSRFGVMFFSDPEAAFTHLSRALRRAGRLVFVCWRGIPDNPWAFMPVHAVAGVVGPRPAAPPDAPGPFAFADAARVRRILEGAGLRDVSVQPFEGEMAFGERGSLEEAAQEIARLGPVARLLVDRDEATVRAAVSAIRSALPAHARDDGRVSFPARAWIVSAWNTA